MAVPGSTRRTSTRLRDAAPVRKRLAADHARPYQSARLLSGRCSRSGCCSPSMAATRSIAPGFYPGRLAVLPLLGLAVARSAAAAAAAQAPAFAPAGAGRGWPSRSGLDYASHDFELKALRGRPGRCCSARTPARPSPTCSPARKPQRLGRSAMQRSRRAARAAYAGLLYWLARRKGDQGRDRLGRPRLPPDAVKLPKKMQRVAFGDDPPSTPPSPSSRTTRRRRTGCSTTISAACCSAHAEHGPVYFHLGRDDVFLAAGPPPSFESDDQAALKLGAAPARDLRQCRGGAGHGERPPGAPRLNGR